MEVSLGELTLSRRAIEKWRALTKENAMRLVEACISRGVGTEIPNERARVLPSGELEIFVEVPGVYRLSMKVPPNE